MATQYHRFDNRAQGGAVLRYVVPINGPEHVSLHRLWLFTAFQDELTKDEHLHLLDCEECCDAFSAQLGAIVRRETEWVKVPLWKQELADGQVAAAWFDLTTLWSIRIRLLRAHR